MNLRRNDSSGELIRVGPAQTEVRIVLQFFLLLRNSLAAFIENDDFLKQE